MTQQRGRRTDKKKYQTTGNRRSKDGIIYLSGSENLHDREIRSQNTVNGTNDTKKKQSRKRKKNRRNVSGRVFLSILGVIVICAGLVYLETLIFKVKQIQVEGNTYTTQKEVEDWIRQNPYSSNTLYDLWYYNQEKRTQLPSVEKVKVSMVSPSKIRVSVTEKTLAGRIDCKNGYLYFDKDGIASLKSEEAIDGVTIVEGMQIDESKLEMGKQVPVDDKDVFKKLSQLSSLLTKNELAADKIICSGSDLTVVFGNVRVSLGSDSYEDKIPQIPPILQKLSEQYADQTGELHLENYQTSDATIRFVPDTQ